MMKNKIWLLIAVTAIIGFGVTGCVDPNGNDTTTPDPCASGHAFPEWTAPTCTAEGNSERACTRSGCTATDTRTTGFAMIDHDWEYLPGANEPTCYAEGSGDRKCRNCPAESKGGTYPKTDHTMSDWHTLNIATCIATGLRERHCRVELCDYEDETPDTIIPKDTTYTGHDWLYDNDAVEATCIVDGLGHRWCQRDGCNVDQAGANFGKNETNHKSLSANFIVTLYPTCTAAGESYKFCSDCQKHDKVNPTSYLEVNALGGHSFPATTPAACTTASITYACNRIINETACGHTNPETVVQALGHTGTIAAFAATCTTAGNSALSGNCVRFAQCAHVVTGEVTAALQHNFGVWAFTSLTERTRTCSKATEASCTETVNVTIAAYITASPHAGTAADPVPLKVSINLGWMSVDNSWTQLLAALNSGGKLVNLDLSDSTRSFNGAFTTGSGWSTAAPGLAGLSQFASLVMPNTTVTSIDTTAFMYCTNLTSVTIPNSVTSIGEAAFYGCTGLTSVTIPNSVTSIGVSAFNECTGLTSVTIPNSVTSIGMFAFINCIGLTSIVIPNSVTSIGSQAFWGTGLTSVTFQRADTTFANNNDDFPNGTSLFAAYITNGGGIGTYIRTGATWAKQ